MKVAIDPYVFRANPLGDLPGPVADLGSRYIEVPPREDFMPFFLHARADDAAVQQFKKALDAAGVRIASNLPLYRWSGPDEDERQAAVRNWKRAIQITVDLGCDTMNSDLNRGARSRCTPARPAGSAWPTAMTSTRCLNRRLSSD